MDIHLDFETYCVLDVRTVGAYRYALDKSCEVLIAAYAVDEDAVLAATPSTAPAGPNLSRLYALAADPSNLFWAHNAQFERAVWEAVLVRRYGAPSIARNRWRCTAALAAQAGLPRSLDKSSRALGLDMRKDPEGARLIRLFCVPRKPTKKNPATRILPGDAPEEFQRFIEYCRQDVRTERGLHHTLPRLPESEQRAYELNCRVNERGLPIDTKLAATALRVTVEMRNMLAEETRRLTDGINPTQRDKLLEWLHERTPHVKDLQAATVRKALEKDLPDNVQRVLEMRLEAGKASTKKLLPMLQCAGPHDNRVRGTLLYYGAHTGREAGRLIQPQNFTRGTLTPEQQDLALDTLALGDTHLFSMLYDSPLSTISQCIRGFIRAAHGRRFVVVDYAAIEARVLAWLAQEEGMLRSYRAGLDVYVLMAALVFGVDSGHVTKEQRRIGKNLVLGCGYGLGASGFVAYCGRQELTISEELGERAVYTYREHHKRITRIWKDVERHAIYAVQSGETVRLRNLTFSYVETPVGRKLYSWLTITLPSGRRLWYPQPALTEEERYGRPAWKLSYMAEGERTHEWIREGTYGGKLVENVVQGISRDLMVHGTACAEAAGYPVVGTVHDELITEPKNGHGSSKELERVVCQLPDWGEGIPINAEAFECQRYRKG